MNDRPAAYMDQDGKLYKFVSHPEFFTPLYVKREWQGLTDELRRLHEVNAELVEALKAALSDDQPYIEKCKAALRKAQGDNNG